MIIGVQTKAVPEKEVTRTDPRKGEFSYSSVNTAECPRKFYYGYILGLRTPQSLAAHFGSCMHEAIEVFYNNVKKEEQSKLTAMVIQAFMKHWGDSGQDNKRNPIQAMKLLKDYVTMYYNTEFDVVDVETEQWFTMPNGTNLLCKMDRVLQLDGITTLQDTKTTTMALTPYYFRKYETDMQISLYYHVVNSLIGCDMAQIDAVRVPHTGDFDTTFVRQSFLRTELQLEEAVNEYCAKTDYIMNALSMDSEEKQLKLFYCNTARCADWGGCPYKGLCKHGLKHPSINEFLRKK